MLLLISMLPISYYVLQGIILLPLSYEKFLCKGNLRKFIREENCIIPRVEITFM